MNLSSFWYGFRDTGIDKKKRISLLMKRKMNGEGDRGESHNTKTNERVTKEIK